MQLVNFSSQDAVTLGLSESEKFLQEIQMRRLELPLAEKEHTELVASCFSQWKEKATIMGI